MRVTILALGSRGDVQPYVALALGLRRAGHTVRVAAAADYSDLVRSYGLPFSCLVGSIREHMDREIVYDALDSGTFPLRLARRFRDAVAPLMNRLMADCRDAASDADALMVSTLGRYCGESVGEALGIPVYATHLHPCAPTGAWPDMFFPPLPLPLLGGVYNRLTHGLGEHGFWQFLNSLLNHARRDVLGLPPLGRVALARCVRARSAREGPILYGYSPLIAPPPDDWDRKRHIVTGYWFLPPPDDWQPPASLAAFLEAGPPPIYVGFGSVLVGRNPDAVTQLVLDALSRAGQRAVLMRGWGDFGNVALPETVLAVDSVPHDWLFPRMAGAVHHGGAGTTAATLRAGLPSVVVPFYGDQRFWGQRLHALGVSPPPLPRPDLTAERLTEAIRAVAANTSGREQAQRLRVALAAEDGAARAVEALTWN